MEHIEKLAQQVERQKKLQLVAEELQEQIRSLQAKTRDLKYTWGKEQRDVEKLNQFSLAGLFYDLMGKKEERLEQEQREVLAAAAKYQAAQAELERAQAEMDGIQTELAQLRGCESRYQNALKERREQLKQSDPVTGPRIAELETSLAQLKERERELQEAVTAGERALSLTRQVQKELDSAENWGTWDMFGGGGLLTQMAKHDHLDSAQELVNSLQIQLRHFRTELTDVQINANFQVRIEDLLRFADWFFDGLIVDWMVQDKINGAQDQIYRTACEIQRILGQLESLANSLHRQRDQAEAELDRLVLSAK